MEKNKICYLSTIIFMIPLIVLSSIILSVKIKTSNLETIIYTSDEFSSKCYNLTYSFIYKQNSDERYLSLDSYLSSFISVCIVIIITFTLKIIFSAIFTMFIEEENDDAGNCIYLFHIDSPARILFFIPGLVCVILLRIRSYTDNCEAFMNYYELCSAYYGENFKNNFSAIINVKTYTLCVVIFFVWEIIYHGIIGLYIARQ